MANKLLLDWFKAARRAGVPLIAVATSDQPDSERALRAVLAPAKKGAGKSTEEPALLRWTCTDGLASLNEPGEDALSRIIPQGMDAQAVSQRLDDALGFCKKLPDAGVVFAHNAHLMLDAPSVRQAVANLRDIYKETGRVLVMLGVSFQLPPEVSGDVLSFDVPLPSPEELTTILSEQYDAAKEAWPKLPKLDQPSTDAAIAAIQGLASFTAEQVIATSFVPNEKLDLAALWAQKRAKVRDKKGLTCPAPGIKLADVGGAAAWKEFFSRFMSGKFKPSIVVLVDEIEKALAGMAGDLSGTTQEGAGILLSYMSGPGGKNIPGALSFGPAGGGKTVSVEALAGEFGVPFVVFNPSSTKGSLVGDSSANMTEALKVIDAMSNGRPLFVATCNKAAGLSAEIRRRFSVLGEWFFDLPGPEERANIWKIHARKNAIPDQVTPNDEGWTGSEIASCCFKASVTGMSLIDAARFVIPQIVSQAEVIKALRTDAQGRFLDANKGGWYRGPTTETKVAGDGRRAFNPDTN